MGFFVVFTMSTPVLVGAKTGACAFLIIKGVFKMAEIIKLKFPDGAVKEFPVSTTTEEIAQSISPGLRKKALAGKLSGSY